MPPPSQNSLENSSPMVPLALTLLLAAIVYLRGWLHLRSRSVNIIPAWRAASFLIGVFLIWIALGSALAAFDEKLLTVHMIQHLLLMTIAPPLILAGAPVMAFWHGMPRRFMQSVLSPLLRRAPAQWLGRVLSPPALCWLTAAAPLVGRHSPGAVWLPFRVTSAPHFWLSAPSLFTRFTSPHQSTLAFPVSKTSNAQAR